MRHLATIVVGLVTVVGCGESAATSGGSAPSDEPAFDCGELAPNLRVTCRDQAPVVETQETWNEIVAPGTEPMTGDLTIPCDLDEPEDPGDQVFVSWEASCHAPLVEEGAVSAELAYSAVVERICGRHSRGSGAATFPTWVASLQLPESRAYRVEVVSTSNIETPYCSFRVGGSEADPIAVGQANLLIAEEQGPRNLSLVLECDGEWGYLALNCYGFDPNGPELQATITGNTTLRVVATPMP